MKRVLTTTILFYIWLSNMSYAQYIQQGIDTVYYFKPGKGQNTGQDSSYFPKNIFGLPFKNATKYTPASTPEDICSLGLGGEIIIGFKGYELVDGPGPDFTIFENAFINQATDKVYAEPAKISVSFDGINYIEFPFDSLTLKGCAGLTPTNGSQDPFNPDSSGGDSFDLASIGLSKIKYIKIQDICEMILKNPSHPYYDPTITGFDLDAVVGLHLIPDSLSNIKYAFSNESIKLTMNNNQVLFTCLNYEQFHLNIYDILGNALFSGEIKDGSIIDLNHYSKGVKFLRILDYVHKDCKTFVIYESPQ